MRVDVVDNYAVEIITGNVIEIVTPAVPIGHQGVESISSIHAQTVVAAIWNIVHNLGFFPNITVVDSAGTVVEGDIEYLSISQIRLTFSAAFAGVAYLS